MGNAESGHNAGSSMNHNYGPEQQATVLPENFSPLDQVISALREAGLESSHLILGIDFTKSNDWTGARSFNGRSLHAIGSSPNPYQQAISIIGRTLSPLYLSYSAYYFLGSINA